MARRVVMGHLPAYRTRWELSCELSNEREEREESERGMSKDREMEIQDMDMDVSDMYDDDKMYREYELMESMRDMEQDQNMADVPLTMENVGQSTREQRIAYYMQKLDDIERIEKMGFGRVPQVQETKKDVEMLLQQEKDRLAVSEVSKGMWPFQNYLAIWQQYKRDGGVDLSQEDFVDALFKLHYEDTDNISDTLKTRQKAEQMRQIFDEKMAHIRKPWGLTQEAAITDYRNELKQKGKEIMETSTDTGQEATAAWDTVPGVETTPMSEPVRVTPTRDSQPTELSGSRSDQLDKLQLKLDELLTNLKNCDYALSIRVLTEDNPPLTTAARAQETSQPEGSIDIWSWHNIYPSAFATEPIKDITEDSFLYNEYESRVKMYFTKAKSTLAEITERNSRYDRDERVWADDTMMFMAPIEIPNQDFNEDDPASEPTEFRMHEFTFDNSDDGWMRLNRIGRMQKGFSDVDELRRYDQYKEVTNAKNAVYGATQRLQREMNAEGKNLDGSAIPIPRSTGF